ncbi:MULTISPECIES: glycosyltransferase family 8 protein [Bacteroides]|uniref:glycosyltransferase family 8 protein n=1 Tax=Bacteroides TaxID=816 RepID=UPI0004B2D35C|nr:glycosyltransferase family 8 protein [Bacteroides neonati]
MESKNIVCGIDDNYYQHCAVMLVSLFVTNKDHFTIYVYSLQVKNEHKKKLEELVHSYGNKIVFIEIDPALINSFPIKQADYLSLATYLRLFIPQTLPSTISKALYVDSDIVFNGDISDLYSLDLSQYSLAGIEDAPNRHPLRLGYDESESYFNAGLVLLNIDYLRSIDFTNIALDYIANNYQKIELHDQDVMNALLHGTVLFIDISWNMLDCFFNKKPLIPVKYLNNLAIRQKSAKVIHFSGPLKPWHHGCSHPLKDEYYKHLKGISWGKQNRSYSYVFRKFKFPVNLLVFCGCTLDQAESLYAKIKI